MRIQYVLSEKAFTLVGSYKTKSGQEKNRYKENPNAKVIKSIKHKF